MNYVEIARALIRETETYTDVCPDRAADIVRTGEWLDEQMSMLRDGSIKEDACMEQIRNASKSAVGWKREILEIAQFEVIDLHK
jgi:hypothetical protein